MQERFLILLLIQITFYSLGMDFSTEIRNHYGKDRWDYYNKLSSLDEKIAYIDERMRDRAEEIRDNSSYPQETRDIAAKAVTPLEHRKNYLEKLQKWESQNLNDETYLSLNSLIQRSNDEWTALKEKIKSDTKYNKKDYTKTPQVIMITHFYAPLDRLPHSTRISNPVPLKPVQQISIMQKLKNIFWPASWKQKEFEKANLDNYNKYTNEKYKAVVKSFISKREKQLKQLRIGNR